VISYGYSRPPRVPTVWPSGTTRQQTSSLNFQAGQNIRNLVVVPVGADGKIQLYNGSAGTVQLVADVTGYIIGTTTATTTPGNCGNTRRHGTTDDTHPSQG
jgi:hypothetical protein